MNYSQQKNVLMSSFRKINVNQIIQKLLHQKISLHAFVLDQEEIITLCYQSRKRFLSQPMLLQLNAPINICGDFHGQFSDLKEVFSCIGLPQTGQNYLFLGDYVDRGKFSLECICLLLAYKIKYNTSFFLLRGNHQCSQLNRQYGFFDQCKRRSSIKVWKSFADVFDCLPVAAVIGNRIFCVHGGISPNLTELSQINKIIRPLQFDKKSLASDLLWSDPVHQNGWMPNFHRGVAYLYGPDKVSEFLKTYDFDLLCRSHQVVQEGYQFMCDKKLITIFSAPNYCNRNDNKGAVLVVSADLTCQIKQFQNLPPGGIKLFRGKRSCTPLNILRKCKRNPGKKYQQNDDQMDFVSIQLKKQQSLRRQIKCMTPLIGSKRLRKSRFSIK